MAATIIDGKAIAAQIKQEVKRDVEALAREVVRPCLAAVRAGDVPASAAYVRTKRNACAQVGITSVEHTPSAETSEQGLLELIDRLNEDSGVHGILVQLPRSSSPMWNRVVGARAIRVRLQA